MCFLITVSTIKLEQVTRSGLAPGHSTTCSLPELIANRQLTNCQRLINGTENRGYCLAGVLRVLRFMLSRCHFKSKLVPSSASPLNGTHPAVQITMLGRYNHVHLLKLFFLTLINTGTQVCSLPCFAFTENYTLLEH